MANNANTRIFILYMVTRIWLLFCYNSQSVEKKLAAKPKGESDENRT